MKRWIFPGLGEKVDPTLQTPAGEVEEQAVSRKNLAAERRVLEARKRAAGSRRSELIGLALSGGGIRSAAFCFGVVQVLEERGLMKDVDYLSTVSGGGYTGTAYSGWRLRQALYEAREKAEPLTEDLRHVQVEQRPPARWRDLLAHLRNFSNYISPRPGVASDVTWRVVSTIIRNLTVHWLAVVSAIVVAFALLLLMLRFLWTLSLGLVAVALVLIAAGLWQEHRARRWFAECRSAASPTPACEERLLAVRRLLQEPRLQLFSGLGFYALAASLWFVSTTRPEFPDLFRTTWASAEGEALQSGLASFLQWPVPGAVLAAAAIVAISAALVIGIGFMSEWRWRPRRDFWPKLSWVGLLFVFVLVITTWVALAAMNGYFTAGGPPEPTTLGELLGRRTAGSVSSAWRYVWQAALVLGLFGLLASIIVAVLNEEMDREEREWSTRIVAVSLFTGAGWFVLAGLALASCYSAERVAFAEEVSAGAVAGGASLSGIWLLVSAWAAKIGRTATANDILRKHWQRILVAAGPTVFAMGLVVLVCFGATLLLIELAQVSPAIARLPEAARGDAILWSGWYVPGLLAVAASFFFISGKILDLNEFSLHGFYRDRLVRCFLGASNADAPARNSLWNIRTDDVPLAATRFAVERNGAPLQLINTAVNLYNSKDLKVQRRRCDSFVLTPLCCGSRVTDYVEIPRRLYIGTAMAISGAAVSPNMGLYTRDPALAALMTFFNLRLGYWFGNPRMNMCNRRKRPLFAPSYMLAEAFAFTNEDRDFVHLSDGGHYDNLGLYELLRRRCRFIVAVDAECDPQYHCTALAWLVRMARIDFGIDLAIDIEQLADRVATPLRARAHWLFGEIHYPPAPGEAHGERGWLLYIKSSLLGGGCNGHVSADVLEYAIGNPDFPHETTADQFFTESQFESYRKLGESIAEHLLSGAQPGAGLGELCEQLAARGVPSSGVMIASAASDAAEVEPG